MKTAFHRFAWGILLVLLDFRIGVFDILPDVAGYAFMWSAIARLGTMRESYLGARPYAVILTLLAVPELFAANGAGIFAPSGDVSIVPIAFAAVQTLLTMLLMHRFFTETARHASDSGAADFAASTRFRRNLFLAVSAVSLLFLPFTINIGPSGAAAGSIVAGVAGIIAMLLLFGACRSAPSHVSGADRDS